LILWKIIIIVATRCQILRLKCTKFYFGWGSAQIEPPQTPQLDLRGPTCKMMEGKRREGKERRRGETEGK